jgi:uncharacterized membrane protein YhaH (DUF805 family)
LKRILTSFGRIGHFGGRDSRRDFWPYCAAVLVLYLLAGIAVAIPFQMQFMQKFMTAANDPQFTKAIEANPFAFYSQTFRLMPDVTPMIVASAVLVGLVVILLAAAAVRRLRDGGMSGWWAVLPIPFYAAGLYVRAPVMTALRNGDLPPPQTVTLLGLCTMLSAAAMIALIVLLCRPSRSAT